MQFTLCYDYPQTCSKNSILTVFHERLLAAMALIVVCSLFRVKHTVLS